MIFGENDAFFDAVCEGEGDVRDTEDAFTLRCEAAAQRARCARPIGWHCLIGVIVASFATATHRLNRRWWYTKTLTAT